MRLERWDPFAAPWSVGPDRDLDEMTDRLSRLVGRRARRAPRKRS